MLLISWILALNTVGFADWKPTDCPTSLPQARAAASAADQAFHEGRTGLTERDNALLDSLELQANCREISFETYCAHAAPLAREAVHSALKRSPRNDDLLLKAQLRNGRIDQSCRSPGHG